MSRVINQLRVCETSFFEGDVTIDNANIIMNTSTGSVTIEALSGSGVAQIPDLGGNTDQFVFEDLAQTLTNKILTNACLTDPKIDTIRDKNNNVALNICLPGGGQTDSTTIDHLQLCASVGEVNLTAVGGSADVDLCIAPKGNGYIKLDGIKYPRDTDGVGLNQFMKVVSLNPVCLEFADVNSVTTTATLGLQTGTDATTVYDNICTPGINETCLIDLKVSATSTTTGDDLGGAFFLKTAWRNGAAGIMQIGDSGGTITCPEDLLGYSDDSEWNISTRESGGSIQICVTQGSSSAASVDWIIVAETIPVGGL